MDSPGRVSVLFLVMIVLAVPIYVEATGIRASATGAPQENGISRRLQQATVFPLTSSGVRVSSPVSSPETPSTPAKAPAKAPTSAKAPIDCKKACGERCKESSRQKICLRACGTCCGKCNCVPPGTSGNEDLCPCYANLKTHRNKHKCP